VRVLRTDSPAQVRRALEDVASSFRRFNGRWERFLLDFDLSYLNERRAAYNRYYVLEKECALRSTSLVKQGFQLLQPATTDDLFREFPLLPIPPI
jgi:hypothetical protein